jgi:hypothetical protein
MSRHPPIHLLVDASPGGGVKFDGEHFGLPEVVGAFMMLGATKLSPEDVYFAPHFLGQCCSLLSRFWRVGCALLYVRSEVKHNVLSSQLMYIGLRVTCLATGLRYD